MRVFLAGATGAIGRHLLPMLIRSGHQVTGMTRTPSKAAGLQALGAEPVVADALDGAAVGAAVRAARPDAVIHQLTAIPDRINPRRIESQFELNDRLRSEGTRILVDAAVAAGAPLVIAQSIAFAYAPGPPGTVHSEGDPLAGGGMRSFARTAAALADLERTVLAVDGIVLRYGYLYGAGTAVSAPGRWTGRAAQADAPRRRRHRACGRSSTPRMPPAPPCVPSPPSAGASTTSSTTSPPRCPAGCRRWPTRSARHARGACPPPSPACWPGSTASRR